MCSSHRLRSQGIQAQLLRSVALRCGPARRDHELTSMYKQIGILTGGGDAPGLNAAIRAIVRTAIKEFGMSCIGIEDSFEGVLGETHTTKLTTKSVSGILPRGGTILGTRNRGSFVKKVDGKRVFREMPIGEALANLDILGIEALIVIGGEGGAQKGQVRDRPHRRRAREPIATCRGVRRGRVRAGLPWDDLPAAAPGVRPCRKVTVSTGLPSG